jgi:hypothetical protein
VGGWKKNVWFEERGWREGRGIKDVRAELKGREEGK